VAANSARVGRFDDDVAAQVRHLAAIGALAQVLEIEGTVERQMGTFDALQDALLGIDRHARLGVSPVTRAFVRQRR
jgi:hypothetical protein